MADIARNPAYAPAELERSRKQALDGLEVAYGDPGQVASLATPPVVYAGTSFAHTPGGTPATLKRLTRQALVDFHDAHWRPDNAILILTGDIDPERAKFLLHIGVLDRLENRAVERVDGLNCHNGGFRLGDDLSRG